MNTHPNLRARESVSSWRPHFSRAWLVRHSTRITLICAGCFGLAGCGHRGMKADVHAPRIVDVVEIHPAHNGREETMDFTGVVRARFESALGFRVAGKVAQRLVDAGDAVKEGQPLLRLDPVDYQLALQAARAAVESARAVHVQASLEVKRVRILVGKHAESRDALERATAAVEASAAQLRSAEAQADEAANRVRYTTLRADSDGVVMTTLADPGQVVSAGQPMVTLARGGLREAAIDIPEGSLERIRGQSATAQLFIDPAVTVPATLREISGVADPLSRTYPARYVLHGDPVQFPLGATVTVTVRLSARGNAPQPVAQVPLASLIDRGGGAAVWVVDTKTSTIQRRPVSIEKLGANTAWISAGLRPGDLVVSLGAQLLNAGDVVRMAKVSAEAVR